MQSINSVKTDSNIIQKVTLPVGWKDNLPEYLPSYNNTKSISDTPKLNFSGLSFGTNRLELIKFSDIKKNFVASFNNQIDFLIRYQKIVIWAMAIYLLIFVFLTLLTFVDFTPIYK